MKIRNFSFNNLLAENKNTIILLLVCAAIFLAGYYFASPKEEKDISASEYSEYEKAKITQVVMDSTEQDETSDGGWRGEQLLLAEVLSGQYKGETLHVSNFVGPLYGVPLYEGDGAVLIISTYSDGAHTATVYEFDRAAALAIVTVLFVIATVAVGGKTGAKSLAGLVVTLVSLFLVLLPALMKGAPTLPTVFAVCAYIAVVSLAILGGVQKKTVCAMLGTISGTALAMFFGIFSQNLAKIDGLRVPDVEPLLQLRQTGTPIGLSGLLVGGIIISALGAVMDVTMGISSSLFEVSAANPKLGQKELFRSGMNIGRDMVGTMTNTLILAFLGSSFVLILYLYSIGLSTHQLLSSSYLSIEVISGISSSIGVILSIPITAFITAKSLSKK
ncbi:MAG: YibE/F family protein [Oscillospiraceae bacterium]|nr:YibE/F family protein [Oscillospiraceae bacterium]